MPDIFGNPTPAEQQMAVQAAFRQKQADFMKSNMAASPGAQAGQALANIFAPWVKKTLDTRAARKTEVERIMEAAPEMTEAEAKKLAKERIKPQYREVRRAAAVQQQAAKIPRVKEDFLARGYSDVEATEKARLMVANDLASAGFVTEAANLRQVAVEELRAEEMRLAKLDELRAETAGTIQQTEERETRLDTETDTYVYLPSVQAGNKLEASEVRLTDFESRDIYDKPGSGWVKVSPTFLSATLDDATVTGKRPLNNEQQEALIANFGMLAGLDVMEAAKDYAGFNGVFPEGFFNRWAAEFGVGPQEVIDAVTVEKKMAADVQSLVKGIPSNYDAKIFERLIPRLGAIKSQRYYEAAVQLLRDSVTEAIEMRVAFHRGTNQPVPDEVIRAAAKVGIDINDVAINEKWRDKEYSTEAIKAWEKQTEARLNALEEEYSNPADPTSTQTHQERKEALLKGMPGG
jgi:tryptophan 2,3-dioxygenase